MFAARHATKIAALDGVFGSTDHGPTANCALYSISARLRKCPPAILASCGARNRDRSRIPQVFHWYAASVPWQQQRASYDKWVTSRRKTRFLPSDTPQCHANLFRAFPVHLRDLGCALQPFPAFRVACATAFHACAAVGRAIAGGRQIDHAQLNAQHILRLKRRLFGHVDGTQQVNTPLSAEIACPEYVLSAPAGTEQPQTNASTRPPIAQRLALLSPWKSNAGHSDRATGDGDHRLSL